MILSVSRLEEITEYVVESIANTPDRGHAHLDKTARFSRWAESVQAFTIRKR